MKLFIIFTMLGGMASLLSACNTLQGVGEDVAATGRAIEKAATPAR